MNTRVQPSEVLTGTTVFRSNASPWCCRAAARSAPTRPGSTQALAEADIHPDWVAGISIGAINAAIIAGNPPDQRVAQLRAFWEGITANPLADWAIAADALLPRGELARSLFNQMSAASACSAAPPASSPRASFAPGCSRAGTPEATSFYDTKLLKTTLERLVDFDRINAGETRFSVGAVNVRTGNFVYFDNTTHTHPARARDGERRAAARLPGRRDRRRALLGRRPRLQHAAAMGGRSPARARTRWPSRSTSGARAASCRATSPKSRRGRRRSGIPAARAPPPTSSSAPSACARAGAACCRSCLRDLRDSPGSEAPEPGGRREGLQHRPPDLPRSEPTRGTPRTTSSRA